MPGDDAEGRAPHGDAVRSLVLRAVGPVPAALVADVTARVSRSLAVPCRIEPPLGEPVGADVQGRDQWDADRLLAAIEAHATHAGVVVAALSARDMGNPIFTHFFGRARLGGRALVVSVARLAPAFHGIPHDPAVVARRASVEVLHELGHIVRLHHCPDPACLMRLARNVEAIDVRGSAFCASCRAALPHGLLADAPRGRGPAGI